MTYMIEVLVVVNSFPKVFFHSRESGNGRSHDRCISCAVFSCRLVVETTYCSQGLMQLRRKTKNYGKVLGYIQ